MKATELLSALSAECKALQKFWDQFWFAPIDLYAVSLFRLLLGLALLGMYAIRGAEFSYFFLDSGSLSYEWAQKILPHGYGSPRPFYLESDLAMQIQGIAHYVLLVLFTTGLIGRNLTWLLFVLNLGLMQRNMTIVYGADLFASFWLFYLSFVRHDKYFTIKNIFRKKIHDISLPEPETDIFSSVGVRLIQLQLCLSYAYTGVEKLKGTQWWEGSAVWYVIGMDELMPKDLSFMMHFPNFVAFMTMATVIFEIYFIFAVWNKKLKPYWLIVGFAFHLGTALFMDLWFFCAVMVFTYLLFIDTRFLRLTIHSFRQKLLFLRVKAS